MNHISCTVVNTMFDAFVPAIQAHGVKKIGRTWEETRTRLARQAKAQLSRRNLRPETMVKWHRLGSIAITH